MCALSLPGVLPSTVQRYRATLNNEEFLYELSQPVLTRMLHTAQTFQDLERLEEYQSEGCPILLWTAHDLSVLHL